VNVRWCAVAFVVLVMASCATHHTPTPSVRTPIPATGSPTDSPTAAPTPTVLAYTRCNAIDLKLGIVPLLEQIGQYNFVFLSLTNTDATACFLVGYPKIHAYDVRGALPLTFHRPTNGSFANQMAAKPPELVRLPPRGVGYVVLAQGSCRDASPPGGIRAATRIVLTLPDDDADLSVTPRTQEFDGSAVKNTLFNCATDVAVTPIGSDPYSAER